MKASLQEVSPNPTECEISKRTDRVLRIVLVFTFKIGIFLQDADL